jgi:inosose dehydratase
MSVSRRSFLRTAASVVAGAGTAGAAVFAGTPRGAGDAGPLYPGEDLSRFDAPITPRPFALRLGYAAITWGGQDEQAIDDIAAVGFRGIQLRSGVLQKYGDRPAELRRRLEDKGLALLCFSSGSNLEAAPEKEAEYIRKHLANARFVKALGGGTLQIISTRPKDRAPTPAEYDWLGRLLNAIGRRTLDIGVRVAYHNHLNGFGEAPDELARVMDVTDRHYVDLLLDTAHYAQGGGDPVAAVRRHRHRLALLHLKDVAGAAAAPGRPLREGHQWVEMGRGRVDLKGVIGALREARYRGPAVIELDAVPEPGRTPRESAEINRRYAVDALRLEL